MFTNQKVVFFLGLGLLAFGGLAPSAAATKSAAAASPWQARFWCWQLSLEIQSTRFARCLRKRRPTERCLHVADCDSSQDWNTP